MISVKQLDADSFEVTVNATTRTVHHVSLSEEYYQKLTGGSVTPVVLIEKSFEFLMEREGNTSILRTFDLHAIGRYFPEYESTIKQRL